MNHKFLSKSSWSIRGNGNEYTPKRNPPINAAIKRKGSERQLLLQKIMHNKESSVRLDNDSNCSSSEGNETTTNLNHSGDATSLRRSKGMSYSVTDLRELSDKSDFDWLQASDGFQQEIKERRLDIYIAEIEMDSVLHLGPTLRSIFCL